VLRQFTEYSRIFGYGQLLAFKVNDLLQDWIARPSMRHARALRLFAYEVPPTGIVITENDLCFSHAINGVRCNLKLRRQSSDPEVFVQVVKHGEYADVARFLAGTASPRIIDAGANVGLTTLYLKAFNPNARIVAIEPEGGNFACLSRCVAENHLQNVTLLNKGLWTKDGDMAPDWSFFGGESWAFSLRDATPEDRDRIPVVSLETILADAGWSTVDVLKVDIEGSEAELMGDARFLSTIQARVRLMCMEVHEHRIKRPEVLSVLAGLGFTCIQAGETIVAINNARQLAEQN